MSGGDFNWSISPVRAIAQPLAQRVAKIGVALPLLAATHAARGQAYMMVNASWNDVTGYARGALYGRAEGTTIYLGTGNDEYGLFLELGTIHMAPRPIIGPAVPIVAEAYFRDAVTLMRGILGG